jgi:hypothetical protein
MAVGDSPEMTQAMWGLSVHSQALSVARKSHAV